jgi:DNA-binding XRE family transcriptional regulator
MQRREAARVSLPHLRAWRMWLGYSQAELARRARMSKATIVYLEGAKARANFVTVGKLAAAMGLPRERLLHYAPEAGRAAVDA